MRVSESRQMAVGIRMLRAALTHQTFQITGGGLNYQGGLDIFVTAFNSSGQLLFSTLVGGSGDDVGTSIAVNPSGFNPGIFVTGYTTSTDFPAFVNQYELAGTQNAFVFILDYPSGYLTMSSTYLGGEAVDSGLAITFDNAGVGYVYVAGQTTSQMFPNSSPLFKQSLRSGVSMSDHNILSRRIKPATGKLGQPFRPSASVDF